MEGNKGAGSSVSAFALTRHFLVAQTFERVFLAEITWQLPRSLLLAGLVSLLFPSLIFPSLWLSGRKGRLERGGEVHKGASIYDVRTEGSPLELRDRHK